MSVERASVQFTYSCFSCGPDNFRVVFHQSPATTHCGALVPPGQDKIQNLDCAPPTENANRLRLLFSKMIFHSFRLALEIRKVAPG